MIRHGASIGPTLRRIGFGALIIAAMCSAGIFWLVIGADVARHLW
jgi:hypothetical protein